MSLNKPTILIIAYESPFTPLGGLGVHLRNLIPELIDDYDITVIGIDVVTQNGGLYHIKPRESPEPSKLGDWVYKEGSYRLFHVFPTNDYIIHDRVFQHFIGYDCYMENALRVLKDMDFDIIHLQDTALWKFAKNMKVWKGSKLITTAHLSTLMTMMDSGGMGYLSNPFYRYIVQLEGTCYVESDKLITVSKYYSDNINKLYMIRDTPVINNGVILDEMDKYITTKKWPRVDINDGPVVAYVGRTAPNKGVERIFDAVPKCPDHQFIYISSIKIEDEKDSFELYEKLVQTDKDNDNFYWFNGLTDDIKLRYMGYADIGLVPSIGEPFGIVALEWMAIETPLIVSNSGGLTEFCNKDNCTLLEIDDDLSEVIKSHKRNNKMVQCALSTCRNFTWKKVAQRLDEIYRGVLNGT